MNKKILVAILCLLTLTGCTKYMQFEDKKAVIDESTGQRMVENILCKTEKTEKTYEKLKTNKIQEYDNQLKDNTINQEQYDQKVKEINEKFLLDDIVECSNFKINSGGYEGIFTTFFVKPLAFLITKLGALTTNYGWAIILVTILIRLVLVPLTKKTAMQSENMKAAQPKLDKLEQKYKNRTDQEAMMMKNQEMLKIYKDNKINPISGCLFAIIQIPLFFAFYEALYRLPAVLEESFLGVKLGLTALTAIKNGQFYYIIFVILVILVTYFSFKFTSTASSTSQQSQMKMMTNISVVMISIASFTVSLGIALYWIINSTFTIVQNLLVKRRSKNAHII